MFKLKLGGDGIISLSSSDSRNPYDIRWYLNRLHRENGPAVERSDGTKFWYFNNQLHREDGPAVEWPDGRNHWYLNGVIRQER